MSTLSVYALKKGMLLFFSLVALALTPFYAFAFARPSSETIGLQRDMVITPQNASRLAQLSGVAFDPWELVLALAWSPDGRFIAASVGLRLVLLSAENLQVVHSVEIGAFSHGIAFNAQGTLLAVGSQDGFVRIWNVGSLSEGEASLTPVNEFLAHKKGVNALVFSPSGEVLITAGNDAVVRLWRPLSGEQIQQIIGGTYAVPAVQFIPRMDSLALLNGEVIRLRGVQAGNILGTFRYDTWFFSLAYHPTRDALAVGDIHNRVYLWELDQAYRSGQERFAEPRLLVGHTGKENTYHSLVWSVAFNPSGDLLASAAGDGVVILWDMETTSMLTTLKGHRRGVTSAVFSPLGNFLASAGLDGRILLWGVNP